MNKRIYALKNGDKPGIYYNWFDLFEVIENMEHVESRTFTYHEDLEDEAEDVPFSFRWAVRQARIYLGEIKGEKLDEVDDTEVIDLEVVDDEPDDEFDDNEFDDDELEWTDGSNEFVHKIPFYDGPDADSVAEQRAWDANMHEHLGVEKLYGSPWVDLIITLNGLRYENELDYTDRYYPAKTYAFLICMVYDIHRVLRYAYPWKEKVYDGKERLDQTAWKECVLHEWKNSAEVKELSDYFRNTIEIDESDIKDVMMRVAAMSQQYAKNIRNNDVQASLHFKKFLQSGDRTLMDIYRELISDTIYRPQLERLTAICKNKDIKSEKKQNTGEEEAHTLRDLVNTTNQIREILKKHLMGQDFVIDKIEKAYFHNIKEGETKKGPNAVFLFAGPPGVGKTYAAECIAKAIDIPYKRFDMSGFSDWNSVQELAGVSDFWKDSKAGFLTSFVKENPRSVILFDEIEKAHSTVIRMFLQIIDEGECMDRFLDQRVSFKQCTLIFTTNAGRQLYKGAEKENLTALSDKVVMDALEKDIDENTKTPFFPPEMVSRFAANTIIMFNHLRSDSIRKVILANVDKSAQYSKNRFRLDIAEGKQVIAATAQYSVGGSKDARNASKLAGKIIDKELYELLMLIEEKAGLTGRNRPKKVVFQCDFTGVDDEIVGFYNGQRDCTILVFADKDEIDLQMQRFSKLFSGNNVSIRVTKDPEEFRRILSEEIVLFCVVDYDLGVKDAHKEERENSLDALDIRSDGREMIEYVEQEYKDVPVYVIAEEEHPYTEREKFGLYEIGVEGFVERTRMYEDIESCYYDVCCNQAVDFLALRHQVVSYKTRKEFDRVTRTGTITFCDMKLANAVDAEDKDIILSDNLRPNKHWEDIFVSDDVREELTFFIDYLKNGKQYRKKGMRTPKGALMYGPPGTGKTSLAKVVAAESGVTFLETTGDKLRSMTSEEVHDLFRRARKYAPCVLFIDEIDAVGVSREKVGINENMNAMLTEMDGFRGYDDQLVFVMAATNIGKSLDPALVRRFDRSFLVDLPKEEGRRWMFQRLLDKNSAAYHISEDELESLVMRSQGMSPADIENVMEMALRDGVRNNCVVDDAMLDEAFEKSRYGEEKESDTDTMDKIRCVAVHEAGHAIVQLHYGHVPNYISVVSRGDFGGYVQSEKLGSMPTKERILQKVATCLGGRAAEMNRGYGITTGASGDLQNATALVRAMVCEWGMYEEEMGLAVLSEKEYENDEVAKRLVNQVLSQQLKEAKRIIEEDREKIDQLVDALLSSERKYLTKKQIEAVYKGGIESEG